MNTTIDVPSNLVIRDLLLSIWFRRGRILLIVGTCVVAAVLLALQMTPKYQSNSSLLVLLGPEYGSRPTAGQQFSTNFNIGPQELLRTEADILNSNDLHKMVIRQFGVATLYPDLVKPPGWLSQQMANARAYVSELLGVKQKREKSGAGADLARATELFNKNFGVDVDKKSNIIHLSFTHENAALSAQVLRVLEADYFRLRSRLFSDKQVAIVDSQEAAVAAQLKAADAHLQAFKNKHDIANFKERQKVLLTQQGALEDQLAKAETAIATQQARLNDLTHQLRLASGQTKGTHPPNAAAALQSMVSAYRRREHDALTKYRGSPAYDQARTSKLKAQEELAKMRSTEAFKLQQEIDKTQAELRGQQAARDAIKPQLVELGKEIAASTGLQEQLHQLERSRSVLEENYKAVAKLAGDRAVVEAIDAKRQPSVRVVESPQVPYLPKPVRRQVVVVGLVIGIVLAAIASLLSIFFRGVYLRPEALEADTGLAVLAVVPDHHALAAPMLLITPK